MNLSFRFGSVSRYALLLLIWQLSSAAALAQQQNVLFIIADDLGVDYTQAYQEGNDFPATPNIDALARDGILFRNAWANPVCSPTRATMLTGQYGFRTNVTTVVGNGRFGASGLAPDTYTLPKALDEANSGYAHACVGKWHLSDEGNGGADNPNVMGFDYFAGFLEGEVDDYYIWNKTVNGATTEADNYVATENVDDAIGWISEQQEPWFHWLAFANPHTPFHKPPNALHSFDNLSGTDDDISENPVPYFKAAVEAMDTEIGRLINYLKETGQYESTIIVYLGDNGTTSQVVQPPFDANQAKGTLYEGGVNVPFIIAGAAVANPNRESNALVSAVDLFATGLELMGVDARPPAGTTIDAQSLVPIIRNQTDAVRDWVFTEISGRFLVRAGKAIRNNQYKLIRFDSEPEELYDLNQDPFETTNLLISSLSDEAQTNYTTLTRQLNTLLGTDDSPGNPEEPTTPRRPRRNRQTAGPVYPNPSQDEVTVAVSGATADPYTYTVRDQAGQTQLRGMGQGDHLLVDISNLTPGTYYLRIALPSKTTTTRIVKE